MRGYELATTEQMLPYMGIIVGLHSCDLYCKHDVLGLFFLSFPASGYDQAEEILGKKFESLEEEEPLVLGYKMDDGIFQFYFAELPSFGEAIGKRLFYFRPPPLCPGKLIVQALERANQAECPPKARLLH